MSQALAWGGLLGFVALASLLLTGLLRRYALARGLMDVPNIRSSHGVPTPRGGGVAIVAGFLAALLVLAAAGVLPWAAVAAMAGGGGLVAVVGFVDDHGHLAAPWRLLAHFAAAGWVLAWLGGAPPVALFGLAAADLGLVAIGLAALYLVWLLNLYNFMDGIDGIAAVEAICVCIGGAALYVLAGRPELVLTPLALASAVAGFLFWNFPPARIFMGDAGSGFLGMMLGALSLQAAWTAPELLWSWLILLGVFVVDATVTLARRLSRGERIYEAHRSHAYQHAARRAGRHLPVTLATAGINVLWLFPIALWVGTGAIDGGLGVLLGYAPLILLALRLRAGRPG
jgi:Fuc2NAc and GlcNAc transferase